MMLVDDVLVQQQHQLVQGEHREELQNLFQRIPLHHERQDQVTRQLIAAAAFPDLWLHLELIGSGEAFFQGVTFRRLNWRQYSTTANAPQTGGPVA